MLKKQDVSVAKAKKAISDYKKAIGHPDGVAELMVFYCERAAGFCDNIGMQDEAFFNALVRMFEQSLRVAEMVPEADRKELVARLDKVRCISHNFGYGVGDDMDYLFAEYKIDGGLRMSWLSSKPKTPV